MIKQKLNDLGLQCIDVKVVHRKDNNNELILYVVYFKPRTITVNELKKDYTNIDHTRVRWDYQKAKTNRVTQCFNCQMFGHGSSRCKVKTFCAICAGNHKTTDCHSNSIKCANCNGSHKAMSHECPSRQKYVEIKSKYSTKKVKSNSQPQSTRNYASNFPNTLNQSEQPPPSWNHQSQSTNNNLFSLDELRIITTELISKLRNCKSKADQFEVITSLAFKFLV